MASINLRVTKTGQTRYVVLWRVTDANGKPRQTSSTFDSQAKAEHWKNLIDRFGPEEAERLYDRTPGSTPTATLTVADWCYIHIDKLTGVEEGTKHKYRRYVDLDIKPAPLGSVPITAVSAAHVGDWVNGLAGAGKTIANKHGFLSSAFASAIPQHLAVNPCDGRRLPRHDPQEMVFLTPAEFKALATYIPDRWKPLATFLVLTGLRFSEATALQFGDLNPTEGTIRVSRAWKYTGNNNRILGAPKSKKSRRTINVPPAAFEACGDLSRPSDAWVFVNGAGNPVRSQLFGNTGWIPAVAAATAVDADPKIPRKPRIHDLRHSCASWLIQAGVPLPVVQQHLGHEDIRTTVAKYSHLDRKSHQQAADALGAALSDF